MKRNLFDTATAELVIKRVEKLQADTAPLWGQMTATEMLLHCNTLHEKLMVPSNNAIKKTSIKQYFIRGIVLYLMPGYPKNKKTPKMFEVKGLIDASEFAEQKRRYIELIGKIQAHTGDINHHHPYFGQMSKKQWGISAYKHADHHLRQFGV